MIANFMLEQSEVSVGCALSLTGEYGFICRNYNRRHCKFSVIGSRLLSGVGWEFE
jgi:hypothetical protein